MDGRPEGEGPLKSLSVTGRRLRKMFDLLLDRFGPQKWWPAENALEMMVGAILTQNTNWKNVERAIVNLKGRGLLTLDRIYSVPNEELAEVIRPAGYFNIKAKRLKNLVTFILEEYDGDLEAFLTEEPTKIRAGLLSVRGVGPETADSIILYGAGAPVFVVDAYTHRILSRHGMIAEEAAYDEIQALFMDHLPEDPRLFNEFHALIVKVGKEYCRRKPLCRDCPLETWGPQSPGR
ncbi:MAG: endonuclease III domain-containing protein [Deltaproteobacteria bacterium]|nr:endonuclease III domain-containing protein [Deltaproteobacteria bacterium]